MSNKKSILLQEVLNLFETMGVQPGVGIDGKLMVRIRDELVGVITQVSIKTPSGRCPLCKAADMMNCDCDPIEQLAALEEK